MSETDLKLDTGEPITVERFSFGGHSFMASVVVFGLFGALSSTEYHHAVGDTAEEAVETLRTYIAGLRHFYAK